MTILRFEIVRSDAEQPWHVRLIASNGEEVWRTSENYADRGDAFHAITLITAPSSTKARVWINGYSAEVRDVDERTGQ